MSANRVEFAYTQARIQARYALLAGEDVWSLLAANQQLASYLDAARRTGLAHWLTRLGAAMPSHALERTLRGELADLVDTVAGWSPATWRPAFHWLSILPLLAPAVALSRRNGDTGLLGWAEEDRRLARLGRDGGQGRDLAILAAIAKSGDIAPGPAAAWLAEWAARLPGSERTPAMIALGRLAADQFAVDTAAARRGAATTDGSASQRLRRAFRAGAGRPQAAIAYLGLALIEYARLRGEIVRRAEAIDQRGRAA